MDGQCGLVPIGIARTKSHVPIRAGSHQPVPGQCCLLRYAIYGRVGRLPLVFTPLSEITFDSLPAEQPHQLHTYCRYASEPWECREKAKGRLSGNPILGCVQWMIIVPPPRSSPFVILYLSITICCPRQRHMVTCPFPAKIGICPHPL